MKRTLLIDGDVICYRVALTSEVAINWSTIDRPDLWTLHADEAETKRRFKDAIYELKERLKADWAIIAVTYDTANFRKSFLPDYKGNRGTQRKPLMLSQLRQFAVDHFGALSDPRLEADDILGILQTGGEVCGERIDLDATARGSSTETVIVSADKDLKTIPGLLYNPDQAGLGVQDISLDMADAYHMKQTLSGDITDNYAGCPGVGVETAEKIISGRIALEPFEHVFKSGKRKGLIEKRWKEVEARDRWHSVVSHYQKAGLTEADALVQARAARILRAEDYVEGEVKLWEPKE